MRGTLVTLILIDNHVNCSDVVTPKLNRYRDLKGILRDQSVKASSISFKFDISGFFDIVTYVGT